jgi:putative membrane protein
MKLATFASALGALCVPFVGAAAQGITHAEITLDDSYILGVRANIDQEEIEISRMALTRGSTKPVRYFAKSLLAGHTNAQNAAEALGYNLKIPLKIPGDTDQAIRQRNADEQASLRKLKGVKFDRAFLTAISVEHAREIQKVNTWYASMAVSDSVKAYLHDIMPSLTQHQQTADKLLGATGKAFAVK